MPAFSLGKGERTKLTTCITPGPGTYDHHQHQKTSGYSITKSILKGTDKSEELKNLQLLTREEAKRILANRNIHPGPANYNLNFPTLPPKKNQWKMGVRTKSSNHTSYAPGPGNYNPKLKSSNTSFSFGYKFTEEDYGVKSGNPVGPGTYQLNSSFEYKERPKAKKEETSKYNHPLPEKKPTVGPGEYDPNMSAIDITSKISMAGRTKTPSSMMNNPGPGTYNTENRLGKDCPAYGFGASVPQKTKVRSKSNSNIITDITNTKEFKSKNVHTCKMVNPYFTEEAKEKLRHVLI